MINWWGLIANSMWIIAAALALAVVSIAYYQSKIEDLKLKIVLERAGYRVLLNLAGAVFCAGMAATSIRWWEVGLWALLGVAFGVQGYLLLKIED